jgi:hypothetical protein
MTTDCRYTVHTAYCDHWRAMNSAAFLLDGLGVAILLGLGVAGLVSPRLKRHLAAIAGASLAAIALLTLLNFQALQT